MPRNEIAAVRSASSGGAFEFCMLSSSSEVGDMSTVQHLSIGNCTYRWRCDALISEHGLSDNGDLRNVGKGMGRYCFCTIIEAFALCLLAYSMNQSNKLEWESV